MLITRLGGRIVSESDTQLGAPDKVECIYEADAALPVGAAVQHDLTSNTSATLVVPTVIGEDHVFCGVYEGKGGTGADTTTSGLSGKAAVDGDIVYVTTHGLATALVGGGGTTIASGTLLGCAVTAGQLSVVSTALVAGAIAPILSLGTTTSTATGTPLAVFVKAL